jgi:hypothetical protein
MNFCRTRDLSPAASDLVQFDADSIRQAVSAQHRSHPDVWLADPDAYEKNGRTLRDSDSPRMLAYSLKDQVLYATDGCNSCAHHVSARLESLADDELKQFAASNNIPAELLQHLAALLL